MRNFVSLRGSFDHSAARRGISPPAGGEFLSQRWERNQRIAGGRLRMDTSCPYSPYPRSPITGVIPWSRQNPSGAQNLSDTLNPRRATGPWVCKICFWCGSASAPQFTEPTRPVRFPPKGRPHGAAPFPSCMFLLFQFPKMDLNELANVARYGIGIFLCQFFDFLVTIFCQPYTDIFLILHHNHPTSF